MVVEIAIPHYRYLDGIKKYKSNTNPTLVDTHTMTCFQDQWCYTRNQYYNQSSRTEMFVFISSSFVIVCNINPTYKKL